MVPTKVNVKGLENLYKDEHFIPICSYLISLKKNYENIDCRKGHWQSRFEGKGHKNTNHTNLVMKNYKLIFYIPVH